MSPAGESGETVTCPGSGHPLRESAVFGGCCPVCDGTFGMIVCAAPSDVTPPHRKPERQYTIDPYGYSR